MVKRRKDEVRIKWNWKIFWIVILIILLVLMSWSYSSLETAYRNYQQEVEEFAYELELNLTKKYANLDCYEKGTVDCYEKGAGNTIQEYLLTHDCYERGYFANKFCYDEPCITTTCGEGYGLTCVKQ